MRLNNIDKVVITYSGLLHYITWQKCPLVQTLHNGLVWSKKDRPRLTLTYTEYKVWLVSGLSGLRSSLLMFRHLSECQLQLVSDLSDDPGSLLTAVSQLLHSRLEVVHVPQHGDPPEHQGHWGRSLFNLPRKKSGLIHKDLTEAFFGTFFGLFGAFFWHDNLGKSLDSSS